MRQREVLVVMPLAEQRGGGELMLVHLLRHGRDRGVRWRVVFLEDGPLVGELRGLGIETAVVEAGRLRQARRYVVTVVRLARLARTSDAVLAWMPKAHLYAGVAAILARRPSVWYQLGIPAAPAWLDRLATLIPARLVLTLSQAGDDAQKRLWPSRRTALVYPGVELDRFDASTLPPPSALRQRFSLPDGPIVGIPGRLQRWKGQHLAIAAMGSVRERFPAATLLVVGGAHSLEPDYEHELRELASATGGDGHVVFAGLQTEMPEWIQAMDVVVNASYGEPFGITIVEAMALGKPMVASDSGGPLEIVSDGVDGLLFRTGDAESLAERLLELLGDRALADRLGGAARARAEQFSAETFAGRLVTVLRDVVLAGTR